ncbi:pth11-like integral membrane protein [Colletotrichum plurivorum]|uniref:Pth11-like integral membrane protein n=1 Tax=Colletotrichum plurivorum TaxID=2175906 RepID=A0A8H6NM73_9PEZI|nr:pth11-like integral membrane protein [Colletotrichum plurivorum]
MEPSPDIVQAFGPPPDGLDITESSVAENNAAVIILAALATVAVALRLYARFLQGHGLHPDDWTIILSLLLIGATVGLSILAGSYGAGNHIWSFTLPDLKPIFKILYAYTFIYASSCAATKISILLFYQRIFLPGPSTSLSFKLSLAAGYFLSLAYPVIVWATMANACRPIAYYWDQFIGAEGECINLNVFYLALGIVNMGNDVVVLLIPIQQILKLQMSGRKKVAVCGVMLLGSFFNHSVCVASILRIHHLHTFTQSPNLTRQMGPVFIWSAIEPAVAIASACLPHLAPLRRLVRNKLSSTQGSGGPSAGSMPWRSRKSGTESQKGAALFTIGGSRFSSYGDGRVKIEDEEDEIGLTERGAKGDGKSASGSREDVSSGASVVQSSFAQVDRTS